APSPIRGLTGSLLSFRDLKIVEVHDTVGLGPKAGFAPSGKRRVFNIKELLAVKTHHKEIAPKVHAESAPRLLRHSMLHAVSLRGCSLGSKRNSLAVFYLVEHHVIFKRVGSDDVVVVRITV